MKHQVLFCSKIIIDIFFIYSIKMWSDVNLHAMKNISPKKGATNFFMFLFYI